MCYYKKYMGKVTLRSLAKLIQGLDGKIDDLAFTTNQSFTSLERRLERVEAGIDDLKDKTAKNGDAMVRLERKVDVELAATHAHLLRIDQAIGLS